MPGCRWNRRFLLGGLKTPMRTSLIRRGISLRPSIQASLPSTASQLCRKAGKASSDEGRSVFGLDFWSLVHEYEFIFIL